MQLQNLKNKIITAALFVKAKTLLVAKSEITKIGGATFFGVILLTLLIPLFFDNSALKIHTAQKVGQILGSNVTIKGDLKIAFLPSPKITANEVTIQNYKPKSAPADSKKSYNFYAKSVEIIFPIFGIGKNISIDEMIFNDAILESHYDDPSIEQQRQDALIEILNKNKDAAEPAQVASGGVSDHLFSIDELKFSDAATTQMPVLTIQNGQRIIYDSFGRKREIKAINAEIEMTKKKLIASGDFNADGVTSDFDIYVKFSSTSKRPRSKIKIISPVLNLNFSGNFTSENDMLQKGLLDHDFNGKITADISELRSFYRSYVDDTDVLATKLKFNGKPINFSAEIENKGGEGTVKNLNIKSNLINGTGQISISQNNKIPLIDIDLNLDSLDLDSILSDEIVTQAGLKKTEEKTDVLIDEVVDSIKPSSSTIGDLVDTKPLKTINLDLTKKIKNFDLTAEIKIKNTKFFNGQITDANLYLSVSKQGEILVMPLIFNIPGEGILRVNGAIDNSGAVPKFIGKIDATGKNLGEVFKWLQLQSQNLKLDSLKNYNLYSDVLLLPNSLTLNNFYLGVNNDESEVLGDIKIDSGGKNLNTISRLRISKFDVDNYFFVSSQNAYLTPGMLLKKLLWLNNISSNSDFDLTFDKLIYGEEVFQNQNLKFRYGNGYFDIYEANLKSQKTDLKFNMAVDISSQDPRFELKIDGTEFDYKTPQKKSETAITKHSFFDQFYSLPSLEEFGGKITLNFTNLKIDDLEFKNLKLSGILKDGNLTNAVFSCDVYGGNLDYKGMLGIKINKTINGNLTFSNVALREFLSDLFGIKNISGLANFSANVTSVADSKEGFAKSLTSEVKFIANTPTVEGYGLTDLIKKMFLIQSYAQELRNPEIILNNSQNVTSFKQAKGNFQISGGQGGKLKIELNAPAVNAILSAAFDPSNMSMDGLFNAIFLTGNLQKQTPINIATSLKGKLNNIAQSTNLDQVRQYLGLAKTANDSLPTPQDKALLPTAQITETAAPVEVVPTAQIPASQIPTQEKSLLLPPQNPIMQ